MVGGRKLLVKTASSVYLMKPDYEASFTLPRSEGYVPPCEVLVAANHAVNY